MNFGGGSVTSNGGEDAFVVKLTTAGAFVWAKSWGDNGAQVAFGVATDPSGDVLVTGANTGTIDFGCGPLTAAGSADIFVAKLTPSGACAWSHGYGDSANQYGNGIVADALGNVIATGLFDGTVDFGGATYTSQALDDAWLLKLDPAGNYLWSRAPGGPDNQRGVAVAVDASNNIALGGALYGSADFGGGTLTSAGSGDAFVAKYDASGNYLWAKSYGDASLQQTKRLAFDPAGDVIVVGTASGFLDFGTGPICGFGGEDMFVAKLSP